MPCCRLVLAWGYPSFAAILNKASIFLCVAGLHNEILRMPPVARTPTKYAAMFNFN